MSADLIALAVALALGAAVVFVGSRRNLSETTRSGLPRFGDAERETATLGLYEGQEEPRRALSPREQRGLAAGYLLLALFQAASVAFWSDDRLLHAAFAAAWVAIAVVSLRRARA